jgi:hypothetical protein
MTTNHLDAAFFVNFVTKIVNFATLLYWQSG